MRNSTLSTEIVNRCFDDFIFLPTTHLKFVLNLFVFLAKRDAQEIVEQIYLVITKSNDCKAYNDQHQKISTI